MLKKRFKWIRIMISRIWAHLHKKNVKKKLKMSFGCLYVKDGGLKVRNTLN